MELVRQSHKNGSVITIELFVSIPFLLKKPENKLPNVEL